MKAVQVLPSVTALAAILFITYNYAGPLALSGVLSAATWFELFIFGLQIAKAGTILSLRELRDAPPAVLVDIFGADLVLLPILVLTYLILGTAAIPDLAAQLIRAWIAGTGLAILIYASYWIPRSMLRATRLSIVLPSTLVIAEVGIVFANAASSPGIHEGGLGRMVTSVISASWSPSVAAPWAFAALGVIYVSMLVYATMGWSPQSGIKTNFALVMAAVATFATAGWVVLFSSLTPYAVLVLLPPTISIAVFSWLVGHVS